MIRIIQTVLSRRSIRIFIQVLISIVILLVLFRIVQSQHVFEQLRSISPIALVCALVLYMLGFIMNTYRWRLMLDHLGVHERFRVLYELYMIGLFCSLFLPTGNGGDVVRAYDVARRSGKTAQTVLATLQERFLGLGVSLLLGFGATLYYLPRIPETLKVWAILMQAVSLPMTLLLMFPSLWLGLMIRLGQTGIGKRLMQFSIVHNIVGLAWRHLEPLAQVPAFRPLQILYSTAVTLAATLMAVIAYYILGQSLNIQIDFMAYCLVIPLVWVVRLAPISLGGIGVGEGAFVFLMGLFSVSSAASLSLALAILAIITVTALIGGVFLGLRMLRGTWQTPSTPTELMTESH